MKNNIMKKLGAVLVSGLLLLSEAAIFAGCKKKTEAGVEKISKDSPWYDATISEIENSTTNEEIEYIETDIIGAYHDGILVRTYGAYKLPDDFDINTSRVGYEFNNLDYYDASGKLVNSIDLNSFLTDVNAQDIGRILLDGDSVYLYREDCDFRDGNCSYYLASLDIEKGIVGEFEKLPYTDKEISKSSFCFPEETLMVGDYLVAVFQDENTARFVICNNGQRKIAALPDTDLGIITGCLNVSEKEIVFICSYGSVKFLFLNLETGSLQDKGEEYSWLNTLSFNNRISSYNGESYFTDQDGLKRINLETKKFEEVVSFDNCNLNRDDMDRLSLCSVNGDKYILAGEISHDNSLDYFNVHKSNAVPTIVTLEKAETNPNVGKVILTAATVGNAEVPYSICEAIRIFNDTNEDYFVRLTYNYDIRKTLDYTDAETEDDSRNIYLKTAADLNDLLAINMLAGDGPDIILNAGDIRQIHTDAHLLSLNSYVEGKKGINTDDYFSNVIDAAKIDDKLLFMPVSFSVSGLLVNKDDVSDDQVGFTYDEYVDFVNEKCGGNDPMVDTRLGVLCTLFSNMSDTCIHDNTVNFDNEPFRKLCEYVKTNVPEKYGYNYDNDGNETYGSMGGFLGRNTYMSSKKTLVGYPSQDRSGPFVHVDTSIGISAFSPSTVADGAWEFIKTCLSDDVQEMIAGDFTNPISKSVFDSTAKTTIENYNISPESFGIAVDESVIDSYKEVLQSASVLETQDPAILSVIREEMPAYFLDQKSLDAVLSIINNRVTTIINERGHS